MEVLSARVRYSELSPLGSVLVPFLRRDATYDTYTRLMAFTDCGVSRLLQNYHQLIIPRIPRILVAPYLVLLTTTSLALGYWAGTRSQRPRSLDPKNDSKGDPLGPTDTCKMVLEHSVQSDNEQSIMIREAL